MESPLTATPPQAVFRPKPMTDEQRRAAAFKAVADRLAPATADAKAARQQALLKEVSRTHRHASIAAWCASAEDFTHKGRTLRFWTDGPEDAPALLLVHGFPTSSWDWRRLWPGLRGRFRLVAMDMLGFGLSDKPAGADYLIKEQADRCEALLAHLNIPAAHVLAHDYGDTVAQELLARRIEGRARADYRSFCFLNGGLIPAEHRARLIQKLLKTPLGPLVSRAMTEKSFARSFSAVFGPDTRPSAPDLAEDWALISANEGNLRMHRLISYMAQRKEHGYRWVGALKAADVPLRLIDGGLDPVSGAHLCEAYRRTVPNADAVLLDHVGHYPQLEDPDAVLKAFDEFHDRMQSA